jgi:hypothetical protein
MSKDLAPSGRTVDEVLIVVSYPPLLTLAYFLSLISVLDRLYNHPMLKVDPTITIFLCIAVLLYVGNNLPQHCVETLLTFLDCARQWVTVPPLTQQQLSFRYPQTVERLVGLFNIGNEEKVFACCPECFQLYTLPDYQPLKEPILELPHKGLPRR